MYKEEMKSDKNNIEEEAWWGKDPLNTKSWVTKSKWYQPFEEIYSEEFKGRMKEIIPVYD